MADQTTTPPPPTPTMTMDEIRGLDERALVARLAPLLPVPVTDLLAVLLATHLSLHWVTEEQRWHLMAEHPTAGIQALLAYRAPEVPRQIWRLALWMATS